MFRKRNSATLVFIVFIGIILFANSQLFAQEKILKYATAFTGIKSLDPHLTTTREDNMIMSALYNGLVRFKPGMVDAELIEPDLASSWTVSKDGTEWMFRLRRGVKWHKGYGELTADDVKFSIDRTKDPKVASMFKSNFADVRDITVLDPYTVRFVLARPSPTFLLRLVPVRGGQIISRKAVTELQEKFGMNPVGTGPFVFKSYRTKDRVQVVANREYFRSEEKPKIDGVEFIFVQEEASVALGLLKGEFHIGAGIDKEDFNKRMDAGGLIVESFGPGSPMWLAMDMSRKPFDDIRVRKAIMHGIDKQSVIDALLGRRNGKPISSPVPPSYFGHTDDVPKYEYDPEKAKRYLKEAGYPDGLDLKIQISVLGVYSDPMVIIQEQLKKIGVRLELQQVEHPAYWDNISKGINKMALIGILRLPDADIILTQAFHSSGFPPGINLSHYSGTDALIDQARYEMDSKKRKEIYAKALNKIMEDCACFPLQIKLPSPARQPYIKYNYNLKDTLTYEVDHFEFVTIEK